MENSHYSRRKFLKTAVASAAGAGLSEYGRRALGRRASGQKPNVVIIFTDDQGYQDVGARAISLASEIAHAADATTGVIRFSGYEIA